MNSLAQGAVDILLLPFQPVIELVRSYQEGDFTPQVVTPEMEEEQRRKVFLDDLLVRLRGIDTDWIALKALCENGRFGADMPQMLHEVALRYREALHSVERIGERDFTQLEYELRERVEDVLGLARVVERVLREYERERSGGKAGAGAGASMGPGVDPKVFVALGHLGFDPDELPRLDKAEVMARYKRLAQERHPDLQPDEKKKEFASEQMRKLNDARDIVLAHLERR